MIIKWVNAFSKSRVRIFLAAHREHRKFNLFQLKNLSNWQSAHSCLTPFNVVSNLIKNIKFHGVCSYVPRMLSTAARALIEFPLVYISNFMFKFQHMSSSEKLGLLWVKSCIKMVCLSWARSILSYLLEEKRENSWESWQIGAWGN